MEPKQNDDDKHLSPSKSPKVLDENGVFESRSNTTREDGNGSADDAIEEEENMMRGVIHAMKREDYCGWMIPPDLIITDHSKPDKAPIKLLVLQTDMRKTMEELCRRKEEVRALKRELGPEEEAISHHDSTQAGAELHSHIPIQCELDDVTTSRTSDINRDRLEEEENEPKSELFVLIEAERKKREEGIEVGREPVLMEEPKWGCVGYLARGFIAPTVRAVVELAFVPSLNVEECQRELGFGGPGPNEETDAGH